MPQFDDELCEDEFEIIEGPVDRKLYRQQTNGILLEFSKEGVKGGIGNKGEMKAVISFKEVFSITCLFPTGFPRAKKPIVFLSNPDPHIVNHTYVDKTGRVTHPDLINWDYNTPLSAVLRTVYNCFLENPPRLNSSAIVWNLKKESAPPPPPMDAMCVSQERIFQQAAVVHNAPPMDDMFPTPTPPPTESKRVIEVKEISVPPPPSFDNTLSHMTLAQLETASSGSMIEKYSADLKKCVDVGQSAVAAAESQLAASSEAVLQATLKETQLSEELNVLKEQANVLLLTRNDVSSRASSSAITTLRAELKDAEGLLSALTASLNSEAAHLDPDFLFGTYKTAATRYHLLKLKLNSIKAEPC